MPIPTFIATAALHIPDGFLSAPTAVVGIVLAVVIVGYALRKTSDTLGERQIPLLGVMAAFIFAAQAINFPVIGGTSGHLIGGALVAIILGPWAGVLVMTVVVGLQSLLFQDGGLLALGWNILNMAAICVLSAYLVYGLVRRLLGQNRYTLIISAAFAAWFSVVLSATSAGLALALSDAGLLSAIPAMAGIHALIGIGEALITVAAVVLITRSRPALTENRPQEAGYRASYVVGGGLIIAVIIAVFSIFSSSSPDGLERVALDFGFANRAVQPLMEIMPDYTLPGFEGELAGIVVVIVGLLAAAAAALFAAYLLRAVKKTGDRLDEDGSSGGISSPGD